MVDAGEWLALSLYSPEPQPRECFCPQWVVSSQLDECNQDNYWYVQSPVPVIRALLYM